MTDTGQAPVSPAKRQALEREAQMRAHHRAQRLFDQRAKRAEEREQGTEASKPHQEPVGAPRSAPKRSNEPQHHQAPQTANNRPQMNQEPTTAQRAPIATAATAATAPARANQIHLTQPMQPTKTPSARARSVDVSRLATMASAQKVWISIYNDCKFSDHRAQAFAQLERISAQMLAELEAAGFCAGRDIQPE